MGRIPDALRERAGHRQSVGHEDGWFEQLVIPAGGSPRHGGVTDSFGNGSWGFTGREYDNATELYYYRARMYDPKLGRFTSEDPIGFAGGDVNLYGYVWNTPTKYLDAWGTDGGVSIALGSGAAVASGGGAGIGAAISAAAPPAAAAAVGAAAIYGAWHAGEYIASHPSNPFVNGPLNPFGTPYPGIRPFPPPTMSRPYCQPAPRAIPLDLAPARPRNRSEPEKDGCDKQYADDQKVCSKITDSQMRGACYAHAFDRWASCKAGRNIPYNPWPQYPWD